MALLMEETRAARGGGARPHTLPAGWLPVALDERLRVGVATAAVALLGLASVGVLVGGIDLARLGAAAMLAAVALSVGLGARRRHRSPVADVAEAATLFGAALLVDDRATIGFVLLVVLANAILHRDAGGRWATVAMFSASLFTLVVALGDGVVAAAMIQVPRLGTVTFLAVVADRVATLAERAVQRERILAGVGLALAAGRDEGAIGDVVAGAAHALARGAGVGGRLFTSLYVGEERLRLVATAGERDTAVVDEIDLARLGSVDARRVTTRVLGDRSVMTALFAREDIDQALHDIGVESLSTAYVLVVPLFASDVLRGLISVSMEEIPEHGLRDALESLGADTALALDALGSATTAAARERQVQRLLTHSNDAITVLDASLTVTFESSGTRLLGWPSERLVGGDLELLPHPDDLPDLLAVLERAGGAPGVAFGCEWRALHLEGHWVHLETIVTNLLDDDDVGGFLLNSRDVSERKALEDRLAHQSLHDPVTGLPNRTLFVDRVAHSLERSKRHARVPAVCFLDLDGFKQVNSTYGHEVGDKLLRVVADRLRGTLREGDTAARFGGDEFAVLMEECDEAQVVLVVERLHQALSQPVVVDGRTLLVKATIGVATPHSAWTSRELLQAVEATLFVAKQEARGSWRRYDDTLPRPGEQDGLLAALEQAVDAGQLRLQYQPVVSLETGAIVAVEALVRWHHPDRGMIPPNAFIPLAERSGLIVPIGLWVMETATRQLRRWHDAFPDRPPLSIHVNVSAVQLADPAALEVLAEVIQSSGVDPVQITLEITESVLVDNPLAVGLQLSRLKDLGVRLAIDDFGVGYAGIGYLREFAVDQLKIDKSFVDNLSAQGDTELFEAMLGFSHAFKLDTVAEGVEHAEQAEILIRLGCTNAQGYHFARPLDPADLEGLLARVAPLSGDWVHTN